MLRQLLAKFLKEVEGNPGELLQYRVTGKLINRQCVVEGAFTMKRPDGLMAIYHIGLLGDERGLISSVIDDGVGAKEVKG